MKYIKSALKIIMFIVIVLTIEHAVYYFMELYKDLPMPCERTETFENFILIVSPKADGEVADLLSDQFLLARIRTNELAEQTCGDVLENHSGPIEIIGSFWDSDFEEYIKTDLSSFDIKTVSDLKIILKDVGYIKGEDLFPEFDRPIKFSMESFIVTFPDKNEKYGFKRYYLFYNDKYIRLCYSSNDATLNYDFVYTVDNNSINVIRNLCQIYPKE